MRFCPECKSRLLKREGMLVCARCEYKEDQVAPSIVEQESEWTPELNVLAEGRGKGGAAHNQDKLPQVRPRRGGVVDAADQERRRAHHPVLQVHRVRPHLGGTIPECAFVLSYGVANVSRTGHAAVGWMAQCRRAYSRTWVTPPSGVATR